MADLLTAAVLEKQPPPCKGHVASALYKAIRQKKSEQIPWNRVWKERGLDVLRVVATGGRLPDVEDPQSQNYNLGHGSACF